MNRFNTKNFMNSVQWEQNQQKDDDDTPLDVVELMENNLQLRASREQRQRFDFIERYS